MHNLPSNHRQQNSMTHQMTRQEANFNLKKIHIFQVSNKNQMAHKA